MTQAFALALFRMTGLFVSAPLFSGREVPREVKLGLGILVTFLILPLVPVREGDLPRNLGSAAACAAAELAAGLTLGFLASMLFSAFQLAGQHIGQQMGIALADVIDPFSENEVPIIGQFQNGLALLLYVAAGGHRLLVGAAAESFRTVPLGGFRVTPALVDQLVSASGRILELSFQIAAPVLAALFLSTVALGFVARAVPQMNILMLSFPLQIGLGLGVLIWTLPTAVRFVLLLCGRMTGDLSRLTAVMVPHGG